MPLIRALSWVVLAVVLMGCAQPTKRVIDIRPGIGAEVDLDALRPPSGVRYVFDMEDAAGPIPMDMSLVARKTGTKLYRYSGELRLETPSTPAELADLSNRISQVFKGSGLRVQGTQVLLPFYMDTDNRFRVRQHRMAMFNLDDRYEPHDCFAQLGTCTSRAVSATGSITEARIETTEEGGIWRSEARVTYGAPRKTRRQTMIYSLDENGIPIDLLIVTRGPDGSRTNVMRRK